MKYLKWICLIIAIIGFIVLGIKFFELNNQKQIEKKEFDIKDTFNTAWYKKGVAYYENKKLFNENFNLDDPRYMVFYETHLEFYNPLTNKKNEYSYSYTKKNKTITINSEDFFLPKGTYNIEFENKYLKLSQSIDGNDYIYYFLSAEG